MSSADVGSTGDVSEMIRFIICNNFIFSSFPYCYYVIKIVFTIDYHKYNCKKKNTCMEIPLFNIFSLFPILSLNLIVTDGASAITNIGMTIWGQEPDRLLTDFSVCNCRLRRRFLSPSRFRFPFPRQLG